MSFSFDMSSVFTNAQTVVNALFPVAAIAIGFTLGFAIINMVRKALGSIR